MKNNQQSAISKYPYRYPGVQPFMTGQANVFFGRDNDIIDLYRLIRREPLVVLYGKSGLGKSSLLNAGIVPKCQETGDFNPVTIRFGAWTEGIADTPLSITKNIISEGYDASTFLDRLLPNDDSLWYHAKTRQLNTPEGQSGGQLLIMFDQFEELFTYPAEAIEAFKEEVAELLHTGIPLRFRRMADEADFLTDEDEDRLEEPLEVRQLFGIRSDRMHLMHQMADRLPNILRNMFELKALQTEDAKDAILLPAQAAGNFRTPPFEWTPAALASLLAFLQDAENDQRVEGILLQLLCQYFEEKMVEGAGLTRLDASDLGKLEEIVEKYYFEKIASIGDEKTQMAARRLIEEGLVLEGENIRLSLHESQIRRQYDVDTPLLERLVNSRLLRSEPFLRGGYSYELAHDRLVPPVLAAKQQRRSAEAEMERTEKERELAEARRKAEEEYRLREKAEKGQRRANIFTIVAVVGLLIAAWQMIEVRKANDKAEGEANKALREKETADSLKQVALVALEDAKISERKANDNFNLAQTQTKEAESQRSKAQTALTNVEKSNAEVVTLLLKNADQEILNLDYEAALKTIQSAVKLQAAKTKVAAALLEIAFWHGEAGNTQRATVLLDSAATLVNKTANILQPFRASIEALDPDVYKKLMERYYPIMVEVEGGTFDMGCDTTLNQRCYDNETLHKQEVSSFQMAKTETTVWQFALYCAATPDLDINDFLVSTWSDPGDNPVVMVSWYQAVEYANWVSRQKGEEKAIDKDSDGNYQVNLRAGYRLPTEAEWEFAAKGGTSRDTFIYSGSNEVDSVAWYDSNNGGRTQPVGTKKANALGLHDMSGNVEEWCWDWYGWEYPDPQIKDYTGVVVNTAEYPDDSQIRDYLEAEGPVRVSRGGTWSSVPARLRCAFRDSSYPGYRYDHGVGFRLARAAR